MDFLFVAICVIYFTFLLTLGLFFYWRAHAQTAFATTNRTLNYWVTALSAQSSDMSAWLFLGFTSRIYTSGLADQVWTAIALAGFMWLNWRFVAPRLRVMSEKYDSATLWTYFERRFNDVRGVIRPVSALMVLVFMTMYVSAGFLGIGRILEVLGYSYATGVTVGIVLALAYTLIGGFLTVAWCNLFQAIFLLAMMILVPLRAFWVIGGGSAIVSAAQMQNISLSVFGSLSDMPHTILVALGWGLGYFGIPQILVNFMNIKDPNEINKARRIGVSWQILILGAAIAIGLTGIALMGRIATPEHLLPLMISQLFGPIMSALVYSAMLAAILSTLNVQLIVSATTFAQDIYKTLLNKTADTKRLALVTRSALICIALVGVVMALTSRQAIYGLVLYAWTGLGCTFGPIVLLSLHSERVNRFGALAGILIGGISAGLLSYFMPSETAMVPVFLLSGLCALVVSYLTRNR